jgi:hypothetical protein
MGGEGAFQDVERDDRVRLLPQGADQSLAKMAGTSRDQNLHRRAIRSNIGRL